LLAQASFLYPFAFFQTFANLLQLGIKQSQHWPISLINFLPVGPLLTFACLNISINIFHATDNHAPILKSIRFHCSRNYNSGNSNFQLTCPCLERADLSRFRMNGTNIQWDNLTTPVSTVHVFSLSPFLFCATLFDWSFLRMV
jgi:hypothetical protein